MIRILFKQQLDEKAFRERRRITLNEVCAETGLSRPTISRLANSPGYRTNTETLDILCSYFQCQPGDLLVHVHDEPEGHNE